MSEYSRIAFVFACHLLPFLQRTQLLVDRAILSIRAVQASSSSVRVIVANHPVPRYIIRLAEADFYVNTPYVDADGSPSALRYGRSPGKSLAQASSGV